MRVLVGCEHSGVVRRALRALGHDAYSNDLLPADDASEHHIQGDVRAALRQGWDRAILHPDCTFLTNAGVRWLYAGGRKENGRDEQRWSDMFAAANFFDELDAEAGKWCDGHVLENPIPHEHAKLPPYTQTIQPWNFGDYETKRTCLWFRKMGPMPVAYRTAEACRIALGLPQGAKPKATVHLASPGPDRWKLRSRTYPGIAAALAAHVTSRITTREDVFA